MPNLTDHQMKRIVGAAVEQLDAHGDDARTVRDAFIGAAENCYELSSLLEVFERINRAVIAELKIMNFEARDIGSFGGTVQ